MEVINELFAYSKYKIYQRPDMFSFSLDSVLLSEFCTINKKIDSIIDLCSGNAPIPMYLTIRTDASIDAVELQKDAYDLGIKSIKANKLEDKINLVNDNVIGIHKTLKKKYDLVTVNPPFFKIDDESKLNKSEYKTIARHELMIKLEDVIVEAKRLLKNGGYLSMVHRPERIADIITCMRENNIQPRRIRFIHPFKDSESNMLLIEGRLSMKNTHLIVEKPMIIFDEPNKYTKEVLEIFNQK